MMKILGKYDNENFTLLNIIDVDNEEIVSVKVHEIIHMLLSLQTKWGIMEYCFNHIGRLIDSDYLYIAEIIHKNCLVVQESIAIFWEKLFFLKKYGKDKFIKSIREERWKNQTEPFCLDKILEIINLKGDLSIDNIAFCLYRIAINSMNIEILDIPVDCWKETEKVFADHNVPNVSYKNMIKDFRDILKKPNCSLDEYIYSIETEWSRADLDNRQNQIRRVLQYIKKICKPSKYYKEIEKYLSSIKCKYIDTDNLEDYIIPDSFTFYECSSDFNQTDNKSAIWLIAGNGADCCYTFKNISYKDDINVIFNLLGNRIVIFYFDYIEKKVFAKPISMSRLKKDIEKNYCPKVISYYAYENNNKLVKILEYNKHRYFVWCDRPYWSAKKTIELNCDNKNWMVVDFGKFDVICLEIGKYGILFIPVCSASSFYEDLDKFYTGEKSVAKTMFETPKDLDVLNLVINCLFST